MNQLLNKIITDFAKNIGRPNFKLDPKLSFNVIFWISTGKALDFSRGVLHGILRFRLNLIFRARGVELKNLRYIKLSKGVSLGKFVTIDGLSEDGVTIGSGSSIGPYSIIEASGSLGNLGKGICIGSNSGLGAYSFIGGAGGVSIGNDVIMGQYISFHSENHKYGHFSLPIRLQGVDRKGITVEDDCWIGSKVTFLDGSYISRGSIVAAGSVVRDKFLPNAVIAGIPARLIRYRS